MSGTQETLTPEVVRDYIAGHGSHCPYCGGSEIEGDSVNIEAGCAWQGITCLECEQTWQDVYFLGAVGVLDASGDPDTIMPGRVEPDDPGKHDAPVPSPPDLSTA